jgi:hypothetical protein
LDCLNPVQKTHKDDKNVNNIYIELLNKSYSIKNLSQKPRIIRLINKERKILIITMKITIIIQISKIITIIYFMKKITIIKNIEFKTGFSSSSNLDENPSKENDIINTKYNPSLIKEPLGPLIKTHIP